MKVVIPVAGVGSRLKPHTFATPKPLMEVAGKPMLEYVIEDAMSTNPSEIIFVVGHKKDSIIEYITEKFPKLKCTFVEQKKRDGDGSAVRIALSDIEEEEELLIIFGDTLIDFNIKNILKIKTNIDSLIFAMEVEEPQNYGVLNVKENMDIYEVEEKPKEPKSNLAIIGTYYFKSLLTVKNYLNELRKNKETIKGEYRIAQVVEKYVKDKSLIIKASKVKKWFDCGRPQVLLDANRYFLEKYSNGKTVHKDDFIIIPPSYVSKTAVIKNCIIGPYASIGDEVKIENSIIRNSIVSNGANIKSFLLKDSLIGKDVFLYGKSNKINLGEKSEVHLE